MAESSSAVSMVDLGDMRGALGALEAAAPSQAATPAPSEEDAVSRISACETNKQLNSHKLGVWVSRVQKLAAASQRGHITPLEHGELVMRVGKIYEKVRLAPGAVLNGPSAQGLLAAGLMLYRHAIQKKDDVRTRFMNSAILIAGTLLCARPRPALDDALASPEEDLASWMATPCAQDMGVGEEQQQLYGRVSTSRLVCDVAAHVMERAAEKKALEDATLAYYICTSGELRMAMLAVAAEDPVEVFDDEGETHASVNKALEDPRATALVEAADAELGQMAFRDLIVSFLMPRSSTGLRRTLLLDRAGTRVAEVSHPEHLHWAHSAAMQMPSNAWKNGVVNTDVQVAASSDFLEETEAAAEQERQRQAEEKDDSDFVVERTCALLAGLSMVICSDEASVRHGDAFGGLVELPFLVPGAVDAGRFPDRVPRLCLANRTWVYYSTPRYGNVSQGLRVHARGLGVDGLLRCVVGFLDAFRA